MATDNTGITSLPETMSQDDPWAWQAWAAQRDPGTYGWQDLNGVFDPYSGSGMSKPAWWGNDIAGYSRADDPSATMTPEQAQMLADAGYKYQTARGPGYANLWRVVDPNGKVVDQGGFNRTQSLHGEDYAMFASVMAPAIAPYVSAGYGSLGLASGSAANAAATGATMGGALGGMRTGTLEGAAHGAALGGLGGYALGGSSVDPYGPGSGWGQDTLTNMGYTPAEIAAIQSGAATVGDAGGISWGGTSDPSGIGSLTDGVDPYAFDAGYNTGDINYGGDTSYTQPGSPVGSVPEPVAPSSGYQEQTVEIRPNAGNIASPSPSGGLPSLPLPSPNLQTPGQVPNQTLPEVPKPADTQVAQKTDLEKFWDWAKANPKLAMQLFGLGASAFKGGSNSSGGAGGPGTGPQAGMTATPAAPLNRHYVAPPPGYRPGFDPEWQYFQPGPALAGTSTTQPVQGKVGIASVYNTPTFTSGSTIGSPSVNKPYTPGPNNNNMTMNGQPLTPTFSSVGAGSPPPANVPQQAAPTYTPEQIALANAYKAHLGFADGAGAGVSTEDALARLANEQRRFDLFGNDSTSLFKNNPALYAAYKAGNAGAFTAALGPQQNNASAAYRYTGDATSAAAGQAELAKLDAQKAAEVAATQPGGPMFGGVGSLPK